MKYEWDKNKNQSNLTKHGISFEEVIGVFDDPKLLTFEDTRFEYGELRLISIGNTPLLTQEKTIIVVVIHTERNQAIRLISARKANEGEKKLYEEQ
jgi:uncharacterized protein